MDPVEIDWMDVDPDGDLLSGVPVASPLVVSLTYVWPVHRIGPDHMPEEPGGPPTHLVIHRDSSDRRCFCETNAVGARLLELIREAPGPGRALLLRIAEELGHPDPEVVVEGGRQLMEGLRERDILLGTRLDLDGESYEPPAPVSMEERT